MVRAWGLILVVPVLVACGGSSSTNFDDLGNAGGAAGSSGQSAGAGHGATGGNAGRGGSSSGAGSSSTGGATGTGGASGGAGVSGFSGCGPCPGVACSQNAITLNVTAPGMSGGSNGVVGSIAVQASGVTLDCTRSGCGFVCTSGGLLANGNYSVALTAPGYQTTTIQVAVTNPTDCGCCGCCPFSTYQQVSLVPDGSPITGCCADLMTDPNNCGNCGKTCTSGSSCSAGNCTPVFAPCVTSASGDASCTDYCKKQGKICAAACGPSGTDSLEWWGQGSVNCSDNNYSSNGTCDQSLAGFTGARCCCAG